MFCCIFFACILFHHLLLPQIVDRIAKSNQKNKKSTKKNNTKNHPKRTTTTNSVHQLLERMNNFRNIFCKIDGSWNSTLVFVVNAPGILRSTIIGNSIILQSFVVSMRNTNKLLHFVVI